MKSLEQEKAQVKVKMGAKESTGVVRDTVEFLDEDAKVFKVPFPLSFSQTASTFYSTCLTDQGGVYVCGNGDPDALHVTLPENGPYFVRVQGFEQKQIVHISVGLAHFTAVSSDGKLFTWGRGAYGALGHGNEEDQLEPMVLKAQNSFVYACAGTVHSAAISSSGQLFTWGSTMNGRLGHGKNIADKDMLCPIPQQVVEFEKHEKRVVSISLRRHTLALTCDLRIWAWGPGENGRLGHGTVDDCRVPQMIESLKDTSIRWISAGLDHSACVTENGLVYTWGAHWNGRLGYVVDENVLVPRVVEALRGVQCQTISCGTVHSVVSTIEGHVYSWGFGGAGRLGDSASEKWLPELVSGLEDKHIVVVSAGGSHTLAIDDSGRIFTWGSGTHGQLSHKGFEDESRPRAVAPGFLRKGERIVIPLTDFDKHALGSFGASRPPSVAVPEAFVEGNVQSLGADGSLFKEIVESASHVQPEKPMSVASEKDGAKVAETADSDDSDSTDSADVSSDGEAVDEERDEDS